MPDTIRITPAPAPTDPFGWLVDTCLPFWLVQGVNDTTGGFIERLDNHGQPSPDGYTRIRVQARQIYVFSHAYFLTGDSRWAQAARHGFAFLTRHGWDERLGGWLHVIQPDGTPLDRRRDTYDLAFILFALGWYHRAVDVATSRPWIERSMDFLLREMTHAEHGGFVEERQELPDGSGLASPSPVPRRQNPHMHLLEAFLVLATSVDHARFLEHANQILALFGQHFFDPATGTLAEFFTEDWRPDPEQGHIREPGHHFEWVWLLHQHAALSGDNRLLDHAARLFSFARDHGTRQLGNARIAIDQIDSKGRPLGNTARLWPQTEMIKAALVNPAASAELADSGLRSLFAHYLDVGTGGWCDQIAAPDRSPAASTMPLSTHMPASSLYHIMMALTEWQRLIGNSSPLRDEAKG